MKNSKKIIEIVIGLILWLSLWWFAFKTITSIENMDVEVDFLSIASRVLACTIYLIFVAGCFLWHLYKCTYFSRKGKNLWAIAILLCNTVAIPVYWALYSLNSVSTTNKLTIQGRLKATPLYRALGEICDSE